MLSYVNVLKMPQNYNSKKFQKEKKKSFSFLCVLPWVSSHTFVCNVGFSFEVITWENKKKEVGGQLSCYFGGIFL